MEKNWYDYPFAWERHLKLPITLKLDWAESKFNVSVKYKQGTIEDTIKFLQKIEDKDFDRLWWLFDFLKEFWDIDKEKWEMLCFDKDAVYKIFETIKDTRFKWVFKNSDWKQDDWGGRSTLYSTMLVKLAWELSIHPSELQKTYTMEQFSRFVEWINYWTNEMSEDWRKENDRIAFNKRHDDADLIWMFK